MTRTKDGADNAGEQVLGTIPFSSPDKAELSVLAILPGPAPSAVVASIPLARSNRSRQSP